MSWTQGIQLVEDMEPEAIKIAQRYAPEGETVACLVWDTCEPDLLTIMFEKDEKPCSSITLKRSC
jgi:hypothetical protein